MISYEEMQKQTFSLFEDSAKHWDICAGCGHKSDIGTHGSHQNIGYSYYICYKCDDKLRRVHTINGVALALQRIKNNEPIGDPDDEVEAAMYESVGMDRPETIVFDDDHDTPTDNTKEKLVQKATTKHVDAISNIDMSKIPDDLKKKLGLA